MAETIFGITDTGRQRDNNEDAFIAQKLAGDRYLAACVIDGVGGYEGGEIAAGIARQTILDHFKQKDPTPEMLKQSFTQANERIFEEKEKGGPTESMACVVTLALIDLVNNELHYAHVGDTRLYLWRDASLVKISKDHSFVGFLEDSGRLTEEAAMNHPKRNEINKALGFSRQMASDTEYIEMGTSPFLPGDLVLLCSDGLTDLVSRAGIAEVLNRKDSLKNKAQALVQQANAKGGKDNITIVLAMNTKKPLKQVALKPAASEKRNDNNIAPATIEKHQENTGSAPATNRGTVLFLSVLSLLLLLIIVWLLWKKGKAEPASLLPAVPAAAKQTAAGNRLQDTIRMGGDTLLVKESLAGKEIRISDSIFIERDSFLLRGPGIRLIADSSYKGPAFVVRSGEHVILDSITLEGFDIGLLILSPDIEMRKVAFVNCNIPVQYQSQQAAVVLKGQLKEIKA
ncbi:MAG TPA: protein phosphatase 2C domain-containing protein, partial [Flavisolibacter sp.]|nr:protein phosphatase 2C domain-containing protein [Flavisolibacter sp.]